MTLTEFAWRKEEAMSVVVRASTLCSGKVPDHSVSAVVLDQLLYLSRPWLCHLQNGDNNSTYLRGSQRVIKEVLLKLASGLRMGRPFYFYVPNGALAVAFARQKVQRDQGT